MLIVNAIERLRDQDHLSYAISDLSSKIWGGAVTRLPWPGLPEPLAGPTLATGLSYLVGSG